MSSPISNRACFFTIFPPMKNPNIGLNTRAGLLLSQLVGASDRMKMGPKSNSISNEHSVIVSMNCQDFF